MIVDGAETLELKRHPDCVKLLLLCFYANALNFARHYSTLHFIIMMEGHHKKVTVKS